MRPSPRPEQRRALAAAVTLALLVLAGPVVAADRELLLEVSVNGAPTDKIAAFSDHDGNLYSTAAELRDLGLQPPKGSADSQLIQLSSFKGLTYRLDERTQHLDITAPISALATHRVSEVQTRAVALSTGRDTGVVVNYDVTATGGSGTPTVNAFATARWFGPPGVLSSDFTASVAPGSAPLVRLDTRYSWSDPATLRAVEAGDVISGALPYTRSVRLGGLQLATNFQLRPDLITYPLPVVSGATAVPSTVDVLLNGVRQISKPVAAGPFYVSQLPVVGGAGQISVVVRDATGQQTTQSSSFYTTSALLRPGLSAYSVEVGAVRRRFGEVSDDYGAPAASTTARYGFNTFLTGEAHAEATARLGLLTGGATVALGSLAVATGAVGASTSSSGTGGSAYASLERSTQVYHLAVSALLSSARYRDIAALNDDPAPQRLIQASAGLVLGRMGSIGVSYTRMDRRYSPYDGVYGPTPSTEAALPVDTGAEHASVASATYSRELWGRVYAYATAYDDIANHQRAVTAGLSFRFGSRGSVNAAVDAGLSQRQASVEASSPEVNPGDVGWRAFASAGDQARALGEIRYRGDWGDVGAGVDHLAGSTYVRAEARGALVFMGKSIYATNTVNDAFAVVDAGGAAGVPVLLDNRVVGHTDAAGRLLVPGLLSYQGNKLALDPDGLPLDSQWTKLEMQVAPRDRSGTTARFDVRPLRAATAVLRLASGEYPPVGSVVIVRAASPPSTQVGYEGQVYVTDITGPVTLIVQLGDQRTCTAPFVIDAKSKGVVDVGVIQCLVEH